MYPIIRDGDTVEIDPADISSAYCGDIIFFSSSDGKTLIHRVISRKKINGRITLITKGDSSLSYDGRIDQSGLLGRVKSIEKENGTLRIDRGVCKHLNILYAMTLPVSKWVYLFMSTPSRMAKKLSSSILAKRKEEYYKTSARNIVLYEEAKKLIGELDGCGIETIMLKGIFLAEHVYGNIALRPMTDVDILIKKEDLPRASEALGILGYLKPGHYMDFLNNDRASSINSIMYFAEDSRRPSIHVHWHIINSTWPLEALVEGIDIQRIWADARDTAVGGVKTLTLAPEHLLIYLAHHGLHHSFDTPAMVLDITETIRFYADDMDWLKMKKEAKALGLLYTVYIALTFVSKVSDLDIPQLETLRPDRLTFLGKIIYSFIVRGKCGYGISYLAHLFMQRGFSSKLRYLFKTIFPSRLVLAHNLRIPTCQVRSSDYYSRITGRSF